MGGKKQKTSSEPWKDIQPFLLEGADYAQQLFQNGNLAPDNAGLGTVTRQGLSGIAGLARNNGVTAGATNALNGVLGAPGYSSTLPTSQPGIQYGSVAGPQNEAYGTIARPGTPNFQAAQGPSAIDVGGVQGPGSFDMAGRLPSGPDSYGSIDPNYGIDAVRQNVLETTLPQVAGMFGTGGFSKSSMAQSAAGRAVASALAPYEYDQVNRNQQLGINQFNTEQDRALNFGLASAGMEADQFNTDESRRLGFDVGERNTRLGQANIDDARAVDFSTQQNAANLAQQNLNSDRMTGFNFGLRDRQVAQGNLNDQERVAFDTQQQAAKLAQLNTNRDVRNSMALQVDDRLRDQYNTQQAQQLSALGLAPSVNAMQYGDAQNLLGVGQIRDQNRQANMSEASEEAQAYANLMTQLGGLGGTQSQSPSGLDTLGALGQLGTNGALAYSLFSGGGGAAAGGLAGGLGGGFASALPLAFCDRRLKRDITPFCTWRGVAIYTFRYLWDDVLRVGPMAQEVPERARIKVGDFYAVNMGAI